VKSEYGRVEIFALTLQLVRREDERLHVRASLQAGGLVVGVGTLLGRDEVHALLDQVERQYGDFKLPVAWETRASPTLRLMWRLDASGHLEGQVEVRDRAEGWAATVRLKGDQSYLPRIALGLRLLLR
jgi:hypothetical protein